MKETYISFGGNVGNVAATLQKMKQALVLLPSVREARFSSLYRTSPVSDVPQEMYLNGVCRFITDAPPLVLFHELEKIESCLGKRQKPKDQPRPIDIDILFYGSCEFFGDGLIIPHPRWKERLFVLVPLQELGIGLPIASVVDEEIQRLQSTTNQYVEIFSQL